MNYNSRIFTNLLRSVSSKGRGLAKCNCELYPTWNSNKALYNTDDIVVHNNEVFIAASSEGCESDDIPGESVHWLNVCTCPDEITPTPTPTPSLEITPTPTDFNICPVYTTPTPELCLCNDYEVWSNKKYDSFTRVVWKKSVWEAFEWEGTDAKDEPGNSIHWKFICECDEIPTPTPSFNCCDETSDKFNVGPTISAINTDAKISVGKFIYSGELCISYKVDENSRDLLYPVVLKLPDGNNIGSVLFYGNVVGDSYIYLSIVDSIFAEQNGYFNYDNICFYGKIEGGYCNLTKI